LRTKQRTRQARALASGAAQVHSPLPPPEHDSFSRRFLSILERRSTAIAIALVALATARIAATYTVFNNTADEPTHSAAPQDSGISTWSAWR
jgi:hypothetical protein